MTNTDTCSQKQTEETFNFKWKKRETYESPAVKLEWKRWLFEKYFDGDESILRESILGKQRKRILDAGCGSGGSGLLLFGDYLRQHDYTGVDISDAVDVARVRFAERNLPANFMKYDLMQLPEELGNFDVIFSEGVLHHTDSVGSAIAQLTKRLAVGGIFMFYVYLKKAPVREFTDDLVREAISGMTNDEAWQALEPLTKLGKILGDLNIEIDIQESIPFLGIERGKINLQRLFYYKICKAYYRPDYTIDEMNHINFDWFRPRNCYRHSPEEVSKFCAAAGLGVSRMHVEESGITVIATKKAPTKT